mmetsp:Transcript_36378/g.92958  ORF Transcript_36378/g.92958 Transcript_36378/m.92958 type:complete len:211 (-) Transcript_36378:893-1525(-)
MGVDRRFECPGIQAWQEDDHRGSSTATRVCGSRPVEDLRHSAQGVAFPSGQNLRQTDDGDGRPCQAEEQPRHQRLPSVALRTQQEPARGEYPICFALSLQCAAFTFRTCRASLFGGAVAAVGCLRGCRRHRGLNRVHGEQKLLELVIAGASRRARCHLRCDGQLAGQLRPAEVGAPQGAAEHRQDSGGQVVGQGRRVHGLPGQAGRSLAE